MGIILTVVRIKNFAMHAQKISTLYYKMKRGVLNLHLALTVLKICLFNNTWKSKQKDSY